MLLLFLQCFTLVVADSKYHQNDYILELERAQTVSYNRRFLYIHIKTFKFNRTHIGLNSTYEFKYDFGNKLRVNVQAYKFQSNEYRLFPITFSVNMCDVLIGDDYGVQNIYKCGNPAKCPFKKGNYSICNWGPDYSKFPPFIPVGQYRVDLTVFYYSEELYHEQYYVKINSAKWSNIMG